MLKKYIKILFLSALFLTPSVWVCAQMFGGETAPASEKQTKPSRNNAASVNVSSETELDETGLDMDQMTPEEEREVNRRMMKKYQPKIIDGNLHINPLSISKTLDGSKRGTSAFIPLPDKNGKIDKKEKTSHIFIYYSNFNMTRSHAAGVGCRVRFNVLTTMDQRLVNLSVKLVWPDMTTNLSFDNVNPNIETYLDYALFGQGCYKMDKIPNIVVNRCRAKGMSQEECAGKIRWLTKSKR